MQAGNLQRGLSNAQDQRRAEAIAVRKYSRTRPLDLDVGRQTLATVQSLIMTGGRRANWGRVEVLH